VIAFASTPPPWPLPAAPFQARPSDPISPRGHARSPPSLSRARDQGSRCAVLYSWLGTKTREDKIGHEEPTRPGPTRFDRRRLGEATQARGACEP
jgi:hypothetical protein